METDNTYYDVMCTFTSIEKLYDLIKENLYMGLHSNDLAYHQSTNKNLLRSTIKSIKDMIKCKDDYHIFEGEERRRSGYR